MKRLLSIVLALVLVLGTLPAFAYDYNVAGKSAGQMLYDNGFIKGNNGDLMEAKKLSRAELAKILCVLYGKEKEAEAFEANHGFTDVPAGHWANPWIAYAKQEGWMKGRNEKTFDPNGTVDEKQLATVLLRVLGFETKDDEYNNAAQIFAAKTAIVLDANKAFSRGQAFDAIWPAVSTPVKADGKILGEVVGKLNPPTPDPLSIKDVQANNLKEIVVSFNHTIDKDNLGAFSLKEEPKNQLSPELLEDGKTIKLTAAKTLKETKYTLVAKDALAKDLKDIKLIEANVEFKVVDTVRPSVEKVEFAGPKNVTVTFSEPMNYDTNGTFNKGAFKIKKGNQTLSVNSVASVDGNKVHVKLNQNVEVEKEYAVTISGFEDLSGASNFIYEANLTVPKDQEKPTAKITKVDEKFYIVEFSKLVKGFKENDFHHTYGRYNAMKFTTADDKAFNAKEAHTTVKVVFYNDGTTQNDHALNNGQVKILIDAGNLVDLWGNKFAGLEEFHTVEADLTKPAVKSAESTDATTLKVVFTEAVKAKESNEKSFFVTKDGVNVYSNASPSDGFKTWTITLKNVKENDKVKLVIKNLEDTSINANKILEDEYTISMKDGVPPAVDGVAYKLDTDEKNNIIGGTLFVTFKEKVDAETALKSTNYKLENTGVYTDLNGAAEFFQGNEMIVAITLNKDQATVAQKSQTKLLVQNVKDQANNTIKPELYTTAFKTFAAASQVKLEAGSIKASSTTEFVAKFNQNILSVDTEKITVSGLQKTDYTVSWSDKTLKFVLNEGKSINVGTTQLTIAANAIEGELTVGEKNSAEVTATAIADGIAPKVTGIAQGTAANRNVITFTTDENIVSIAGDAAIQTQMSNDIKVYFGSDELTVADGEIEFVAPSNSTSFGVKVKKLTVGNAVHDFTTLDDLNAEYEIKVVIKDAKYIMDAAKNPVKDYTGTVTLDIKDPTVVGVEGKVLDSTKYEVKVTFSEKMDTSTIGTHSDWSIENVTTQNSPAVALSDDGKTITFEVSAKPADGKKLTIPATIKDEKGNAYVAPVGKSWTFVTGTTEKWELK